MGRKNQSTPIKEFNCLLTFLNEARFICSDYVENYTWLDAVCQLRIGYVN